VSLELFFGFNQLIFPSKWFLVNLTLICHLLVLDFHLKAMGPIYGYQPIWLFYFIFGPWTLDSRLKWLKIILKALKMNKLYFLLLKMKDYIHKSLSKYYKGIGIKPIWRFTPKYVRNMWKVSNNHDYSIHGTSSK
jgi:hypothetical protein